MDPVIVDALGRKLAEHGITGLVLAILFWLYRAKDKELAEERAGRLADRAAFTDTILEIQREVINTVDKSDRVLEAAIRSKPGVR